MARFGGIILAAGMSSRMGQYKPLMMIHDKCMIDWTIDSMLDGGVEDLIVVLGHRGDELRAHIESRYDERVRFVKNENYANSKMFDSVVCGMQAVHDVDGVFLLLADMPGVSVHTFQKLIEAKANGGKPIIFPTLDGWRKHPPLIDIRVVPDILGYEGQEKGGLRAFWKTKEEWIQEVPVEDPGCWLDADYMSDIEKMREYLKQYKG